MPVTESHFLHAGLFTEHPGKIHRAYNLPASLHHLNLLTVAIQFRAKILHHMTPNVDPFLMQL